MSVSTSAGGWSPYPHALPPDVERAPVERAPGDTSPLRVVALGATCDLRPPFNDTRRQSFSVSEFAVLGDGRRVILHNDRGFTLGAPSGGVGDHETAGSITRDALNVLLPDDDDSGEEHPWWWLAELARSRGLDVTAEDLRALPYEVVLTDGVIRWLDAS